MNKLARQNPILKPGTYIAARFGLSEGLSNGDVVVGKVVEVKGGRATIIDLVTKKERSKQIKDLFVRNFIITKAQADKIVEMFGDCGYVAARRLAVSFKPSVKKIARAA